MATYYVDAVNGNNGNAGTSSGAAKQTLAGVEAIGLAAGDLVHIAPGVYRETWTPAASGSSGGGQIEYRGDVGGLIFGRQGPVRVSGRANDTSDAVPARSVVLSIPSRTYLYFRNISFEHGGDHVVEADGAGNRTLEGVQFDDCLFLHSPDSTIDVAFIIDFNAAAAVSGTGLRLNRCAFISLVGASANYILLMEQDGTASSDIDIDIEITNCVFWGGGQAIRYAGNSGATGGIYGVVIRHCTFFGHSSNALFSQYHRAEGTHIYDVRYCAFVGCNNSQFFNSSLDQITGNSIIERQNVALGFAGTAVGAYSTGNVDTDANFVRHGFGLPAMAANWLYDRFFGLAPFRSFGVAYLDGVWDTTLHDHATASAETTDMFNDPRPLGRNEPDVGAVELTTQPTRETSVVPTGEDDAAKFAGAGYVDTFHEVDAASTTITVAARRDTNYTGSEPRIRVLNIPGVADQADEMAGGTPDDTWEDLSVTFSPTSAGVVRVRRESRDTSATGICYFGQVEVS